MATLDDFDFDDLSPQASDVGDFGVGGMSLDGGGATFATLANLPDCIDYLQSALSTHGVPAEVNPEPGPQAMVDMCNAMYGLLRRLQDQIERTEKAEEQIVKLNHSVKVAKQAATNLQASLQEREKEIGQLRNQISTVVHDQAGAKDKAATERRELQRKCVDLETRSKRMQTELKRKEQELTKANTKLRELLDQKSNQARHMRQLSSALSVHSRTTSISSVRSDNSEGTTPGGSAEKRLEALKDTYETRYRELAAKHTDLQTAYSRLQDTYKNMLFQQLRSGSKPGVKYASDDDVSDDDDDLHHGEEDD